MLTEYLVRHNLTGHWSSLTIDANDAHALVYQDGHVSTVATDTAECILAYCRQSGDYTVEEIYGQHIGA